MQSFDIDTLETKKLMRSKYGMNAITGITHWHREVGTDNSIYLMGMRGGMFKSNYVELQRYTPEHANFSNPEVLGSFDVKKPSLVHSFSVTENYAIIFYYPVVFNTGMCWVRKGIHGTECIEVLKDEPTDIYIMNLKTNEIEKMSAHTLFSLHHINAYEINEGTELVLDMTPVDPLWLKEFPLLKNMINPPEYSHSTIVMNDELIRYNINLQTKEVTSSKFENLLKDTKHGRYINNFDLGVINEAYRGKQVIFIVF